MQTIDFRSVRAARLQKLTLITVAGDDAAKFLQGQCTQNMLSFTAALGTTGIAMPNGRLLAVSRYFVENGVFTFLVPAALAVRIMKRLSMYVLRSKVTVALDTSRAVLGLLSDTPIAASDGVFPLPSGTVHPALPHHAFAIVPVEAIPETLTGSEEAFWAACITAGEPWVWESTYQLFIPQSINLELVGGVSFDKGCYTGQEVVNRVEHIGHTPRRTILIEAEATLNLAPGQTVSLEANAKAYEATVVDSALFEGRNYALIQCSSSLAESDAVESMTLDGSAVNRLSLPYSFKRQR